MKNRKHLFILIPVIIGYLLAGCTSSGNGPDDVYWKYWEACSKGKFSQAETYLSEDAKSRTQPYGICGFTHDAINNIEIASGEPAWTFSQPPEVIEDEDFALLTWISEEGSLAHVTLIKADGIWKIDEASWIM